MSAISRLKTELTAKSSLADYIFTAKNNRREWAVKRFFPDIGIDPTHYETVVEKMRRAGLPIIKMGFLQHGGKWVQVTPLFGSTTKGSTLSFDGKAVEPEVRNALQKPEKLSELLNAIAGIANLGYPVTTDSIAAHIVGGKVRFIIHDIDLQVKAEKNEDTDMHRHLVRTGVLKIWIDRLRYITQKPKRELVEELKKRITHEDSKYALKVVESHT